MWGWRPHPLGTSEKLQKRMGFSREVMWLLLDGWLSARVAGVQTLPFPYCILHQSPLGAFQTPPPQDRPATCEQEAES